jgi:hypothetical protein
MECAHCGFENREGKRFCVECGAALARRCPGCATEVEPSEKFCGECGTALAGTPATPVPAPVSAAVRKTVTVLFADLSGSTGSPRRVDCSISENTIVSVPPRLRSLAVGNGSAAAAAATPSSDVRRSGSASGASAAPGSPSRTSRRHWPNVTT